VCTFKFLKIHLEFDQMGRTHSPLPSFSMQTDQMGRKSPCQPLPSLCGRCTIETPFPLSFLVQLEGEKGAQGNPLSVYPCPSLLSLTATPTDPQLAPSRRPSSPRRPYQAENEARTSPSLPPLVNATRGADHNEPRETDHLELPQYTTDLSCTPVVNSTQRLRLCLPLQRPSNLSI
jgi:hypothetical protein